LVAAKLWVTCSVSPTIAAITSLTRSTAVDVAVASSLTSLATTPNPRPVSPARAASIVALSASRFVCRASRAIRALTSAISPTDRIRLPILPAAVREASWPEEARPAAAFARWAMSLTAAVRPAWGQLPPLLGQRPGVNVDLVPPRLVVLHPARAQSAFLPPPRR
jgi:hypothetical protein